MKQKHDISKHRTVFEMKVLIVTIVLFALWVIGCSNHRTGVSAAGLRDSALDPLVGQRVTLRGTLHSAGKLGPFLLVGKTTVYMKPVRIDEIYHYGKIYDELNEHPVEVTGTLHFEHYPPVPAQPGTAPPFDHYWFEDETVQIRAVASEQPSQEQLQAQTARALELERRADLVIDYEWIDRIRLSTPDKTKVINATDDTLAAAIASATPKRELAFVIIGKPVRSAYQEPRLGEKVNAIEAVVKAQGFTKVVFQLASGTERPIYRE
jgi:hypothetical protein